MEKKLLLQLLALFFIAQALGLFVAQNFIAGIASGEIEQPAIVSDNPDDISNALALIAYILVGTVVFLFSLKFLKKPFFLRLVEIFIVFITSWLVFEFAFGEPAGIALAIVLVALRAYFSKNVWLRNATGIISVSVVGSLVGVTLGIVPVLVFIIALAVYDYIAVFKTKHMVTLAKGIQGKNLAFTVAMPTKQHTFELGTGDLVVPLAFATSAMRGSFSLGFPNYFIISGFILLGSILGLIITIEYVSRRVGTALPALPLQTGIMIIFFGIGKLAGF